MDEVREYRSLLISTQQRAQEAYDRTLVLLSGGALGVSFAFVTQFLADRAPISIGCLAFAWGAWVLSLGATLFSHLLSAWMFKRALQDLDDGKDGSATRTYDTMVTVLNAASGLLFLVGVGSAGVFVVRNL